MKICIEGCAHGDLDNIYNQILIHDGNSRKKTDLLICCGDFQATRNLDDLACMAVPIKYLEMCSFYKYHQGEKTAPILTIFIGGNHEASNHLQELSYGGWVAPNIYYLGYAGVVQVNGIRIAGISGIFRGYNYEKGHHEIAPYDEDTVRSVYSIRKMEVFKLNQLTPAKIDIMLSHDWPNNIWEHGDESTQTGSKETLLRYKPHFKQDMDSGRLGSKPCWELLKTMKPKNWFAAHMHCRFDAIVKHNDEGLQTKFVALDKCLPRRKFFEFIEIGEEATIDEDGNAILEFTYDPEWLTILSLTNRFLNCTPHRTMIPMEHTNAPRWNFNPTQEEIKNVLQKFGDIKIPNNFKQVVAGYNPEWDGTDFTKLKKPKAVLNPQTKEFCDRLGIDDPLLIVARHRNIQISMPNFNDPEAAFKEVAIAQKSRLSLPKPNNSEEIDLTSADEDDEKEDSVIDSSRSFNTTYSKSDSQFDQSFQSTPGKRTSPKQFSPPKSPVTSKCSPPSSAVKRSSPPKVQRNSPSKSPVTSKCSPPSSAVKRSSPPKVQRNSPSKSPVYNANEGSAKKFKRRNYTGSNDD